MIVNLIRSPIASPNSRHRNVDYASQPFANENSIRAYLAPSTSSLRKRWIVALNRLMPSASNSTGMRCCGAGSRKSSEWSSKLKKGPDSSNWCRTPSRSWSLTSSTFLPTRSTFVVLRPSNIITAQLNYMTSASIAWVPSTLKQTMSTCSDRYPILVICSTRGRPTQAALSLSTGKNSPNRSSRSLMILGTWRRITPFQLEFPSKRRL